MHITSLVYRQFGPQLTPFKKYDTVSSRIEAVASISFFVQLRLLFERGLNLRVVFIHFCSHCSAFVNPLNCIKICLKLCNVFEIEICYVLKLSGIVAMAETGKRKCLESVDGGYSVIVPTPDLAASIGGRLLFEKKTVVKSD